MKLTITAGKIAGVLFLSGLSGIVSAQINPLAIGIIHPDASVVVTYDVTINNPLPAGTGVVKIGNQATLSGGNFANIVTDDPDTGTPLDTTFTPVINLLPVTLIDFTAMKQKAVVLVQWRTSMEQNSDHFEVQQSTDAVSFGAIGNVAAAGQSSTEKAYSFIHTLPAKGINYYRLKQYDLDGHAKIFYVRSVRFDESEMQSMEVYPNPVTRGSITVQMNAVEKGNYTLSLYNAAGEKISSQQIAYNGSGAGVPVSLPTVLSNGIYQLELRSKELKLVKTILVQR